MENQENKIKKVLFNEVSFLLGAVGVISSAIFWVQNPQTALEKEVITLKAQVESAETVTAALEKIKNNDLHEVQLRLDRIEDRQLEQIKAVARIEALLSNQNR